MGVDMKFKAKPKLTPERLMGRLGKATVSECALRFETVNVEIHSPYGRFDNYEKANLVRMINYALLPDNKTKVKIETETHCDADFY